MRNPNDGSGRGASILEPLTGAVTDTSELVSGTKGWATGMFSPVEGTIEVKLVEMSTSKIVPITAYKDYIWNIESIGAGGTVAPANVVLFWQ